MPRRKNRLKRVVPIEVMSDPRALYDFFMEQIEPELTTENIALLDDGREGETAETRARRYERYRESFALVENLIKEFLQETESRTKRLAKAMDRAAEADETSERNEALKDIDQQMNAS